MVFYWNKNSTKYIFKRIELHNTKNLKITRLKHKNKKMHKRKLHNLKTKNIIKNKIHFIGRTLFFIFCNF